MSWFSHFLKNTHTKTDESLWLCVICRGSFSWSNHGVCAFSEDKYRYHTWSIKTVYWRQPCRYVQRAWPCHCWQHVWISTLLLSRRLHHLMHDSRAKRGSTIQQRNWRSTSANWFLSVQLHSSSFALRLEACPVAAALHMLWLPSSRCSQVGELHSWEMWLQVWCQRACRQGANRTKDWRWWGVNVDVTRENKKCTQPERIAWNSYCIHFWIFFSGTIILMLFFELGGIKVGFLPTIKRLGRTSGKSNIRWK